MWKKEHFLPATEYINSLPTVEYASSETLAQTMNGLKQTIFIHRWPYWVSIRKYRACEFFQHHYNGHYKPATGICYIREHRNDEKTN